MGRAFLCIVAVLSAPLALAQANNNLQALFLGLTKGTEVTLMTPLANGMAEVTSFRPPAQLSGVEAAQALELARQQLAALGVAQPTGQQLAVALVGGPVNVPTGSTQLAGVLPKGPAQASVRTQIITAGALPQGQLPGANGAALTHAEVAQALQLATQQLALHGIVNPTAEQIRVAMFGGTITPVSGPSIVMPGVVPGASVATTPSGAVGGSAPALPSR